ncbi:hypothetical protein WA588_006522, partial [Blastocystis sp. NMH]
PEGSSSPVPVPDGWCSGPLSSSASTRSEVFFPDSYHICVNGTLYDRVIFIDSSNYSYCSDGYISVYPSDIIDYMTILPFIASSTRVPLILSSPLVAQSLEGDIHFSVGSVLIEEILNNQIPFRFTISASNSVSSAECEIRVWYEDRNEPPIIANATFSLPLFSEEGTVLGRVFAADPDEVQELQFSI